MKSFTYLLHSFLGYKTFNIYNIWIYIFHILFKLKKIFVYRSSHQFNQFWCIVSIKNMWAMDCNKSALDFYFFYEKSLFPWILKFSFFKRNSHQLDVNIHLTNRIFFAIYTKRIDSTRILTSWKKHIACLQKNIKYRAEIYNKRCERKFLRHFPLFQFFNGKNHMNRYKHSLLFYLFNIFFMKAERDFLTWNTGAAFNGKF